MKKRDRIGELRKEIDGILREMRILNIVGLVLVFVLLAISIVRLFLP